jgi:hypothetical protein
MKTVVILYMYETVAVLAYFGLCNTATFFPPLTIPLFWYRVWKKNENSRGISLEYVCGAALCGV